MAWDLDAARSLGERLQALRTESGLSQEELAHRANLTKNHVGLLEAGIGSTRDRAQPANPRMSTLYSLAEVLGVEPAELLSSP